VSLTNKEITTSNQSFQNSKEWLDNAIKIAGSKHRGTYEAAYEVAYHLICFYREQRNHSSKYESDYVSIGIGSKI
jgi:hypothetical protein